MRLSILMVTTNILEYIRLKMTGVFNFFLFTGATDYIINILWDFLLLNISMSNIN